MGAVATAGKGKSSLIDVIISISSTRYTDNTTGSGTDYTALMPITEALDFQPKLENSKFNPPGGLPARRIPTNPDWTQNWKGIQGADTPEIVVGINSMLAAYGRCWARIAYRVGSSGYQIYSGIYESGASSIEDINKTGITISCDGVMPTIG